MQKLQSVGTFLIYQSKIETTLLAQHTSRSSQNPHTDFIKYFGNIYLFNEIFQNAMPLCLTHLFLPCGPCYIFSDVKYM